MKTLFNKFMMVIVAVVMVVGFSAFKMTEKNKNNSDSAVDYYWFEISGEYDPNDQISPEDASFLNFGSSPEDNSNCTGSTHLCIGGFTSMQIDESDPNNITLVGLQEAVEKSNLKN